MFSYHEKLKYTLVIGLYIHPELVLMQGGYSTSQTIVIGVQDFEPKDEVCDVCLVLDR